MQIKALCSAILLLSCISFTYKAQATQNDFLQDTIYETVGLQQNVDPYLLYSIALVESAKKADINADATFVAPSPYAIRTPNGAVYPKDYAEAKVELQRLIKRYGKRAIDVGMMQINGQHFNKVKDPTELLNPITNVSIAATILNDAMQGQAQDLELAIGRYHSYTEWRARAYGARVLAVYSNIQQLKKL